MTQYFWIVPLSLLVLLTALLMADAPNNNCVHEAREELTAVYILDGYGADEAEFLAFRDVYVNGCDAARGESP